MSTLDWRCQLMASAFDKFERLRNVTFSDVLMSFCGILCGSRAAVTGDLTAALPLIAAVYEMFREIWFIASLFLASYGGCNMKRCRGE